MAAWEGGLGALEEEVGAARLRAAAAVTAVTAARGGVINAIMQTPATNDAQAAWAGRALEALRRTLRGTIGGVGAGGAHRSIWTENKELFNHRCVGTVGTLSTPLMYAVSACRNEDPESEDEDEDGPVQRVYYDMVATLLAHGADPNAVDQGQDKTVVPLLVAIGKNSKELVHLLMLNGAEAHKLCGYTGNPNFFLEDAQREDDFPQLKLTPLLDAIYRNRVDLLNVLLPKPPALDDPSLPGGYKDHIETILELEPRNDYGIQSSTILALRGLLVREGGAGGGAGADERKEEEKGEQYGFLLRLKL